MKSIISISLLTLIFVNCQTAAQPNGCGDWQPFGHSKCFKVFEEAVSYEDAEATCIRNSKQHATLAIVKSAEEQAFLEKYIQDKTGFIESVWLDARFSHATNKFQWSDKSELYYHNWAAGNPKGGATLECVQINADQEEKFKWSNQDCSKTNVPVCQKMQDWSTDNVNLVIKNIWEELEKIKQESEETKQHIKETNNKLNENIQQLEQAKHKLNEAEKEIVELKQSSSLLSTELTSIKRNPVPIGFIYVQLPNQPEPANLWPSTSWSDSSKEFAGLFFRVSGGNSAAFGSVQQEFSPRIVYGRAWWGDSCDNYDQRYQNNDNFFTRAASGPGIETRKTCIFETALLLDKKFHWACRKFMQFDVMNGEVRPKNTAVKIWKRTA